jgi:hypothetical protein
MVVTVKGVFDNRTSHTFPRTATSVEFTDNLEGPVDFVNAFSNALLVMGQPVRVTPTGTLPNTTVLLLCQHQQPAARQRGEVSGFHAVRRLFWYRTEGPGRFATTPIRLKAISALDLAKLLWSAHYGGLFHDQSIFLPSHIVTACLSGDGAWSAIRPAAPAPCNSGETVHGGYGADG